MAALGGAALLAMSLFCGLACIVPAAAGLIACGIYRRKKGRKTHIAVRIPPWALSSARWYPLYVSHSRKQDKIKADTLNGSR